jgi:uncharacterized protein (DUF2062 family)
VFGRLVRRLRVLLQVDASPAETALAFSVGVFVSFSPLLGVHMLISLGLAAAFRLNRTALFIGTWVNTPWTMAPVYTAGTLLGCALLGISPASLGTIDWSRSGHAFYRALWAGFGPLLLPFVVGNLVIAAVAAVSTYWLVRGLLQRRHGAGGASGPDAA